VRLPLTCRRGTTLLEVIACLAVLGLFVTGFVRHLGGAAAAGSRLAERTAAEEAARGVRALLSAEDPWAAPVARTFSLTADGSSAPSGAGAYDVRIDGTVVCSGGVMPADNEAASVPGSCADGTRAVRRWHVALSYATRYTEAGRESVTSELDMDAGSRAAASTGALLP
jgi:hypothetical protein